MIKASITSRTRTQDCERTLESYQQESKCLGCTAQDATRVEACCFYSKQTTDALTGRAVVKSIQETHALCILTYFYFFQCFKA